MLDFVRSNHGDVLKAIRDTGNVLVSGTDPHDSVGILDLFFPEARFF